MYAKVTTYQQMRKAMKLSSKTRCFVFSAACLLSMSISYNANAQGVDAGTDIKNIAVVNYTMENVDQEPIESSPNGNSVGGLGNGTTTSFVVDRKIDLLITGNTNANVAPGNPQEEVTYTLQNQGNATQEFSLSVDSLINTDEFDVSNCQVEVRSVDGTPLPGVVLPTSGNIKLAADQLANISVYCDIPVDDSGAPIAAGDTADVSLKATVVKNEDGSNTIAAISSNSSNVVDTYFSDDAGSDDNVQDASHTARRTYIATSASSPPLLVMNKTILSVIDANGGNKAISGSEVTYKIAINSTGTGTIENLVVTDQTPSEMTYKSNSIIVDTVNQTDLSDPSDNTDFNISAANTATINLGNFAAGNQYEILLTYIIN